MKGDGFHVDPTSFGNGIRTLSRLNDKSQEENLLGFGRTLLTNRDHSGLIDIMPPAGHGAVGHAAKIQGEKAIDRDLSRMFVGVRLKGARKEQHPDVEALHLAAFVQKRPGTPMRNRRAAKFWVDQSKLRALRVKLFSRVGRLAASLLVAAHRLGVRAPAWIERHGPRNGECHVQLHGPAKSIEIAIHAPDNSPVGEIERRVGYAMEYTEGRVQRAIEGTIDANARKAGFKVG